MSQIIDQGNIPQVSNYKQSCSQKKNHSKDGPLGKFPYKIELSNLKFQTFTKHTFKQQGIYFTSFSILFSKYLFQAFDILYTGTINQEGICIRQSITVLRNGDFFYLKTKKKQLQAFKAINHLKYSYSQITKILIDGNGNFKILLPKNNFSLDLTDTFASKKKSSKSQLLESYIRNVVSFAVEESVQLIRDILQTLTNIRIPFLNLEKQLIKNNQKRNKDFELYRCLLRSSIQLRFDCTEGSALYEQVATITETEERQIEQRMKCIDDKGQPLNCIDKLYHKNVNPLMDRYKEAFHMTPRQKQATKALLQIPEIPYNSKVSASNGQNKYNFNNITLAMGDQNQKLMHLNEGGFGKVELGNLSFWYISPNDEVKCKSSESQDDTRQDDFGIDNKVKKKILAIKTSKISQNKQTNERLKAKQTHQKLIIQRFKGLSCQFVPKFYNVKEFFPKNISGSVKNTASKFQQAIISQVTNCYGTYGYTLGNLFEDRWDSLSLKKIIFLMGQLSQVLRFLHLNKIVHLDVKPQNVLLAKNFSIKLIDYGEAYHPSVYYNDSPPAYTFPYGCPQLAQGWMAFPEKSDVFSFAVMLFQLIYGKDIVSTKEPTLIRAYMNENYLSKFFMNIQELQNYGDNSILPILNNLIFQALQPDPDNRPSMTWVSVLFKKIFELLH